MFYGVPTDPAEQTMDLGKSLHISLFAKLPEWATSLLLTVTIWENHKSLMRVDCLLRLDAL